MELGVAGYLPLSSRVGAVVDAVRCIDRGGTPIAPNAIAKMAMSLQSRALTRCEVEALRLIMQGLPDKAIADRWERSVETAKAHGRTSRLKRKASNRVEVVAVARRRVLLSEESTGSVDSSRRRAGSPQNFSEHKKRVLH
jgi:DNA-binding NarL/FixJ family response regulator